MAKLTREEFKQSIQKMLGFASPEKQAEASELLTTLSDSYEESITEGETAAKTITELTANNETLRNVNSKLFLRVGETEKQIHKDNPSPAEDEPILDMKYENLFNEKGELL